MSVLQAAAAGLWYWCAPCRSGRRTCC